MLKRKCIMPTYARWANALYSISTLYRQGVSKKYSVPLILWPQSRPACSISSVFLFSSSHADHCFQHWSLTRHFSVQKRLSVHSTACRFCVHQYCEFYRIHNHFVSSYLLGVVVSPGWPYRGAEDIEELAPLWRHVSTDSTKGRVRSSVLRILYLEPETRRWSFGWPTDACVLWISFWLIS